MEGDRRYFPTPTRNQDSVAELQPHARHKDSKHSREGRRDAPAPSCVNNSSRSRYVNSRSFSTLTTPLTEDQFHPPTGTGSTVNEHSWNFSHSETTDELNKQREGDSVDPVSNRTALTNSSPYFRFPSVSNDDQFSPRRATGGSIFTSERPRHSKRKSKPHYRHPRMGILEKNDGLKVGENDSLGFQVGESKSTHGNNWEKKNIDDQNCGKESGCSLKDNETTGAAYNLKPTHNDSDRVLNEKQRTESSPKNGHFGQDGQPHETQPSSRECTNQQGPQEQVSFLPSTPTQDKSNNVFKFRTPSLSVSPPKVPHAIRRQLSKRKSEIFGAIIPEDIPEEDVSQKEKSDDEDDFHSLGRVSDPCTPTSPKTRRLENYDPYQIFEVQHTPCLILTVKVLRGRNITMGYQDFYDTPDPYINLVMKSSPEGRKSTTVKDDEPNPVWDETFTFFINFTQANVLEITLMESNSLWFDQCSGTVYFDIVNMIEMDTPQVETFIFDRNSEVDIEFLLEFDRNPTLRYSLCLSDQEKTFMEQRKEKVMEGMRKLLGEEDAPRNVDEVPTIAVIGSGGGFRAMTGYSGVFKALVESGVLDCSTYACGLSGSSWLLSTLYSHPKWPNIDMNEFLDELKNSIDKSLVRFFSTSTIYNYAKFMVRKRSEGQPVSFTDIFGRMVGETLLKDRMDATLTAQRDKIKDGQAPMPLYTCVHVKKDVPARSFQEWVEFSPYEIGLPKYGTFMDSELFGSKFFMGKLVKQYKEQPLHFLQGIWGSAFCILFKRLLEDNRRIDPAEMIRQEMGKQLEEERDASSSDCSDEEIELSSSSTESNIDSDNSSRTDDNSSVDDENSQNSSMEVEYRGQIIRNESADSQNSTSSLEPNNGLRRMSESYYSTASTLFDGDSAYEGEEEEEEDDEDEDDEDMDVTFASIMKKRGSVEMKRAQKAKQVDDSSTTSGMTIAPPEGQGLRSSLASHSHGNDLGTSDGLKKSVNWGECPTRGENSVLTQKREAYSRGRSSSMRKSRTGSKSYWKKLMSGVFESNSWELLSTRRGRAAVIHNFMRGLSLQQTYPLSPFTPLEERVKEGDEFDGIFEMHPTSVKHIYMVDAGLTFNSPYPLVLRPQREVDIILSFDFSARDSDSTQPFKELLLAEKWARLNRLPFPPIDTSVFEKEGMKELYIFRHPNDPHCPIVFHFVLINQKFKYYKKPGVPRQTKEEFDFAEFDIFNDPKAPYSTFNFNYQHQNFERLSQLMEFNTLSHIEDIKEVIKEAIKTKREGPPRLPIQSKDIKLLRMKSVQDARKLRKFISRMESKKSTSSPSTPFLTSSPSLESNLNPFFSGFNREVSLNSSTDSSNPSFITPRDTLSQSFTFGSPLSKNFKLRNKSSESREFEPKGFSSSFGSSVESVFGTPPKHFENHQKLDESFSVKSRAFDNCDGPARTTKPPENVSSASTTNSSPMGNNKTFGNGLLESTTGKTIAPSSPSKTLALSPKLKIPGSVVGSDFTPTNSSGVTSSSGLGSSISTSTPQTGQSNIKRKEPPPNPFFVNAHFMRSNYNTSSSSSSSSNSSSASIGNESAGIKRIQGLRAKSSRLSPQVKGVNSKSSCQSPLATPQNKSTLSSFKPTPLTPSSPENFTLAPEAFKRDGTPVVDSEEAKKYYEHVKEKRKLFRRQSTISSLNSISLDPDGPCASTQSDHEVLEQPPIKRNQLISSDSYYSDIFKTCDEGMEEEDQDSHELKTLHPSKGYGVEFDVSDLSQFNGVDESKMVLVDESLASEKDSTSSVGDVEKDIAQNKTGCQETESFSAKTKRTDSENDTWHDAQSFL